VQPSCHRSTVEGWLFREPGAKKAAEIRFSEATSLDCKSWVGMQGLASCRRLKMRYEEGADLVLNGMEVVPRIESLEQRSYNGILP